MVAQSSSHNSFASEVFLPVFITENNSINLISILFQASLLLFFFLFLGKQSGVGLSEVTVRLGQRPSGLRAM